jgi:hypothetical protein
MAKYFFFSVSRTGQYVIRTEVRSLSLAIIKARNLADWMVHSESCQMSGLGKMTFKGSYFRMLHSGHISEVS